MYWSHSLNDLKTLVRIKGREQSALVYQNFENLRLVASEIFGKAPEKGTPNEGTVGSWEELVSAFRSVGGTIG